MVRPGSVIKEAWTLYTTHWLHLVSIAFVIYLGIAIVTSLLIAALGFLGAVASIFVWLVGVFWLQGSLVVAVQDIRDGRADLTIRETLGRVWPRVGTLAAAGLVAGILISIGLVLLIVPGLVLLTFWLLIVPVIVLEDSSFSDAFGRSRELVRGQGWNVFGVILLTVIIWIGAGLLIAAVLRILPNWLEGFVSSIVTNSLLAPIAALAWTLVYFQLRGRQRDQEAWAAP